MPDPVLIDSVESLYKAAYSEQGTTKTAMLMLWLRSWLTQVSSFDPVSGHALDSTTDDFCYAISTLIEDEAHHDFTQDRIYQIINHSNNAITAIMGHAREKILREHAMLPIHTAKEVDSKSVQWLGRLPGRTIREKLAGKPYMYAVRRRSSVDTAENKLFKAFTIRLEQVLIERQKALNPKPEDIGENMLVSCQRWFRSEEAGDIGAWDNLPPNNILLQDKHYRKIWDAWLSLRRVNESIKFDVTRIPKDILSVIFWETLALFNLSSHFRLVQQPIIFDYEIFDIATGSEIQGYYFPPSESKYMGKITKIDYEKKYGFLISQDGTDLFFHMTNLANNVDFSSLSVGDAVDFKMGRNKEGKCANGIHLSRGSLPAAFSNTGDECLIRVGDLEISLKIQSPHLIIQQVGGSKRKYELTPFNLTEAPKTIFSIIWGSSHQNPVSTIEPKNQSHMENSVVDLCSIRPKLSDQSGNQTSLPFRFLLQQWPSNGSEMSIVDCGLSKAIRLRSDIETISMRTLFDPNSVLIDAVKSDASMIFAKKLYDHVSTGMLTYLMPDWMNDFDMERIRKSINFHFDNSSPLPKSIAGVFAWQSSKTFAKNQVRENDIVLVIDLVQDGYSVTPLEAMYKQELKTMLPETLGIYWERHPTTNVNVPGLDESMERYLSEDGCSDPRELIQLFASDGLKNDAGELSFLINNDWYHLPEFSQEIKPYQISADAMNKIISTIAGKLQLRNIYVLTLDDAIEAPYFIESYLPINESLSVVEGGGVFNQWQKVVGNISLWRDHLPELSIRIVRHGHFEDFYLVKDAAVTPQRGKGVNIAVEESFTLPAGQSYYSFPLQQGEGNKELNFNAHLKSPAFPLSEDVTCTLQMTYTYGEDDPYELKFIPADSDKTGFSSVRVEWRPASANSNIDIQSLPVPDFPARKSWSEFQNYPRDDGKSYSDLLDWVKGDMERICDNANFLSGLESTRLYDDQIANRWNWNEDRNGEQFCTLRYEYGVVFFHESNFDQFTPIAENISFNVEKQRDRDGYVARDVTLGKSISERLSKHFRKSLRFPALTIWNQGHSMADDEVPQTFRTSVRRGIEAAQDICLVHEVPESIKAQLFFFLCCLQKDAPDSVVNQLLLAVKDKDLFRKHCWNIAYAIGEAELPWQQELFVNVIKPIDNEGLTRSIAMEILAIAFWRSEALIRLLTEEDLKALAQFTIGCLEFDIKKAIINGPGYHIAVLGRHLELLLALLRSRGSSDAGCKMVLAPGKKIILKCIAVVDEITKVVIDNKFRLRSRISLHIEKPEMFKTTPDLLYALRMYLTGDSGANTISVTAVNDE